jgi:hypothetical protein
VLLIWNDKLRSRLEFNTLCFVPPGLKPRDAKDRGQAPPVLKEDKMEKAKADSVIAVFADHPAAEAAVKKLLAAGFETKNLSVVGKGYHADEKVLGFYNIGDRVKFWGTRGAFWGGLWGMFFGGLFLTRGWWAERAWCSAL